MIHNNQPEFKLQQAVCRYLKIQYPDVLFLSDTGSGMKLTQAQNKRNKTIQKENFSCPDVLIFERKNSFSGLFLELKKETPYKIDGTLKKKKVNIKNSKGLVIGSYDHYQRQALTHEKLNKQGYYTCFVWSFDQAKKIIDNYMSINFN